MELLLKLGGLLIGPLLNMFTSSGASKPAAVGNGMLFTLSLITGAIMWLFGPGREWIITLNALELCGVVIGGSYLLSYFHKLNPPGGGV